MELSEQRLKKLDWIKEGELLEIRDAVKEKKRDLIIGPYGRFG